MLAHLGVDVVLYVILVPSFQSQNVLWILGALACMSIALIWAWRGLRRRKHEGTLVDLVPAQQ
jgi:hypothetical protein